MLVRCSAVGRQATSHIALLDLDWLAEMAHRGQGDALLVCWERQADGKMCGMRVGKAGSLCVGTSLCFTVLERILLVLMEADMAGYTVGHDT